MTKIASNVVAFRLAGHSYDAIARLEGRSKSSIQWEIKTAVRAGALRPKISVRSKVESLIEPILDDWFAGLSQVDIAAKYEIPNIHPVSKAISSARARRDPRALTAQQIAAKRQREAEAEFRRVDDARWAARPPSPAETMGIKIGITLQVRDYTCVKSTGHPRNNMITLSAGDDNWNCVPRHFYEEGPTADLLAA